jgi:hypothetical protein
MEQGEWDCGLETEGYDARCVHCGNEYQDSEPPKYCCNGRECGCHGQPINNYDCGCQNEDNDEGDNG